MKQVTTIEVEENNPFVGFWDLTPSQQDEFIRNLFNKKNLFLNPVGRFMIISASGSNRGILNPSTSTGVPLYFAHSKDAKHYVEARRKWFEGKNMPGDDVLIGKFCPINQCTCLSKNQKK
jgi:hypothetical protein